MHSDGVAAGHSPPEETDDAVGWTAAAGCVAPTRGNVPLHANRKVGTIKVVVAAALMEEGVPRWMPLLEQGVPVRGSVPALGGHSKKMPRCLPRQAVVVVVVVAIAE